MTLSIIIRSYNEEKHIGKLLAGIMEQTVKDVEIILVDSSSTDATVSIATQFPVKVVTIKPEDFTFGHALNVGCEAATGDILLFASAHVYPVYVDWLEHMLRPFEDEKVALVYGKQQGNELTRYSEHRVLAKWFPDESTNDQKHPFCNNANTAIRRSLWLDQPYDETLTGLEDLDWATKIMEKDYKVAYSADAAIVHVHEETWRNIYNRYRREAIAVRLIRKNEGFNLHTFFTLLFKNWYNDYRHAIHDGVFVKNIGSIFLFRLMQFWGTYRGYKQSYLLDNAVRERFYYPEKRKGIKKDSSNRRIDYTGHN